MTVRSSFFNSVNGDRRYLANNFAEYFASFIANGIFPNPSNTLQVYEKTNMTVTVKPGKGWINGYFAINEYDYDLTLDNADGILNRIDRIVLRLDFNARTISIAVKKGTFASTPVAPILQRDADVHELALADVYVTKGTTSIKQSNITDQRLNNALCGVVHGTVSQVDTTTIFNQYSAWFAETAGKTATEISQWQLTVKAEFDQWFASIQNILDGDVAANLATRITTLEQELATHQVDLSHVHWIGEITGVNSLVATDATITELKEGLGISFKNTTSSTGATTLNINNLGAIPILKANGNPVTNLKGNGVYTLRYSGGNFTLQGEGGEYGTATANEVLKGYTIGTENGLVSGLYSNIKSLQVANITYYNRSSYVLNINSVNVSNSIVIAIINMPGGNIAYQPVVELTSSTTVNLSSTTSASISITIQVIVVEFNNVKNKLTGSFTNSNSTTFTTAISTVNPNKCLAFGTVSTRSSAAALNTVMLTVTENLLTADVFAGPNTTGKIAWQILEFN